MEGFWIHKNCVSACILIDKAFYIKEKKAYSLKVSWYSVSFGKPVNLLHTHRLVVKTEDFLNSWVKLK